MHAMPAMPALRTVSDHQVIVLANAVALDQVEVPLLDALGQCLARDIVAPWPLPSFDNSSMDGYAVISSDLAQASEAHPLSLKVIADAAAGSSGHPEVRPGTAVRIMTGAPLPAGADAVVPIEATDGGTTQVLVREAVTTGAYIRRSGGDVASGSVVMSAGTPVTDRSLAVLASVGNARVAVFRRPRVVVISTGDELVEAGNAVTFGKIVDSNGVMLAACAREAGAIAVRAPLVRDREDDVRAALDAAAAEADIIVTSGGVSMGAYDTMKAVLSHSGEVVFAKVAMHPGMPQGTGHVRLSGGPTVPIVTLPGNPVSSFISFELFVRPLIRAMMGFAELTRPLERARSAEAFDSPEGKQQYVRAVMGRALDGSRTVRPVGGQGSHVVGGLALADCLVVVPVGVGRIEIGDEVDIIDLTRR